MLKDPRNLLWILPLAALLAVPLWKPFVASFLSPEHSRKAPSVPSLTATRALTSSEMKNIHFEQSTNGEQEWILTAGRLFSAEDDTNLQLEDVSARFFGSTGSNKETEIRSQKARYNAETKKLSLQGKVIIQNDRGYEMKTESLDYLAAERKIRTTSAVNIKGSNIEVSGKRLLYDTVTGNYRLDGNVVCRVW